MRSNLRHLSDRVTHRMEFDLTAANPVFDGRFPATESLEVGLMLDFLRERHTFRPYIKMLPNVTTKYPHSRLRVTEWRTKNGVAATSENEVRQPMSGLHSSTVFSTKPVGRQEVQPLGVK